MEISYGNSVLYHGYLGFLALTLKHIDFNTIKKKFLSVKNKNYVCKDYIEKH